MKMVPDINCNSKTNVTAYNKIQSIQLIEIVKTEFIVNIKALLSLDNFVIKFSFVFKEKKLHQNIHSSIDVFSGRSEIFDIEDLEKIAIDDMFLLFLPDFSMRSPFYYFLSDEKFKLFHKLAEQVTEEMFREFINNDVYQNKIFDILVYAKEYRNGFPLSDIENHYCDLSYDEDIHCIDQDILKLRPFLLEISEKIKEKYFKICN